jgi:hypothetical protein
MKKLVFALALVSICGLKAQSVRIWADSNRVEIGNPYQIYVQAAGEKPATLALDAWYTQIGAENVLKVSDWTQTGSNWNSTINCIFFDSASLVLPPLVLNGQTTDSLRVSVYPTTITDTTLAPIHEIVKAPPAEPEKPRYWLLAAAIALLVAFVGVLAYLLTRRKKPKQESKFEPIRHQDAWITQFNALNQRIPMQPQRPYYEELSYLLRSWLELQHHIPALERTTDEILTATAKSPALRMQAALIAQVLERSDLVKFAKEEPPLERQMEVWQMVRAIVSS